jgi:hypothetical protein
MADIDRAADSVLPLGGPHDPEAVADAAALCAELVRRLNHTTADASAVAQPVDVDRLVAHLQAAVAGLPQVCHQLAGHLALVVTSGRLYADEMAGGHDPVDVAAYTRVALGSAAATLHVAAEDLRAARNQTARLGIQEDQ